MEEIKEKMNRGLTIGRIPGKTYKQFVELAKNEFCNDYGLTLKHVLGVYKGLMPLEDEALRLMFKELEERIESIEQKLVVKQEEKKVRKNLDGTTRR